MKSLLQATVVLMAFSGAANAASVTCTATCVLDEKGSVVRTVQSRGIDQQDAVIELKAKCDNEGDKVKSGTHYLATSFSKPNPTYTAIQTDFDVTKACF